MKGPPQLLRGAARLGSATNSLRPRTSTPPTTAAIWNPITIGTGPNGDARPRSYGTSCACAARVRRDGFGLGRAGKHRSYSVDYSSRTPGQPPSFAFAFDIDGVLLHVAKPIPGATETLRYLQQNAIPFILLTNGGGKHEKDRVAELSAKLDVALSTENFVQSHTPFQELVRGPDSLADKNVLVTGSDPAKCRLIAEQYGFNKVIIPADILQAHPTIFPFEALKQEVYARSARALPEPQPKIDAVFVFNDPRDWALDTQIIMDLLLSERGVLGTYSKKNGRADLPNGGWQEDGQPAVFFSNPDLVWSAAYHLPRLGQGAFQGAMYGIWREITGGRELRRTVIGKPHRQTYHYGERVLNAFRAKTVAAAAGGKEQQLEPLRRVYMVGDNPASDIQGANNYASPEGTDWTSLLVRTGVWSAERGDPAHRPKMIVDDVAAAVEYALKREGWR